MENNRRDLLTKSTLAASATLLANAAGAMPRASAPGSAGDFDFLFGAWRVAHRRLKRRLAGDDEWQTFAGTCAARPLLGGLGNVDDNWLDLPGGAYRAVTLRAFDPAADRWAIWWLDARNPHRLDVPVIGGFSNGEGAFFADDVFEGRAIRVRFLWTRVSTDEPRWEQAFSADGGAHWETNWIMNFTRS